MILLAAAAVVLPLLLAPEGPRWLGWVLGATMSCSVVIVGAVTWLAGHVGHPVFESALPVPLSLWVFGWPLALMVLTVLVLIDTGRLRWRLAAVALLLVSTPLGQFVLTPMLMVYASHDSTPWTDAVGGTCLVAAAGALWLGTDGDRMGSRTPLSGATEDPTAVVPGPLRPGAGPQGDNGASQGAATAVPAPRSFTR